MGFQRRLIPLEAQEDGAFDRRDSLYFATRSRGIPMPNRWATDGLGLIPTIINTNQLQQQLNALFGAILSDLQTLKSRA